jgi:hypothetical protein
VRDRRVLVRCTAIACVGKPLCAQVCQCALRACWRPERALVDIDDSTNYTTRRAQHVAAGSVGIRQRECDDNDTHVVEQHGDIIHVRHVIVIISSSI